jgi:hypothetical protein
MPGQSVPGGFKLFLTSKVPEVPALAHEEQDHVIRRAVAIWRLCWHDVTNGWELVDEKLKKNVGENWREEYEKRNGEVLRTG